MAEIILDVHAEWKPAQNPPFTIVPKGSTMKFYTENMKLLLDGTALRKKLSTLAPSQEVGSQMSVQNYLMDPADDEFPTPAGMTRVTADQADQPLCTSDQCVQKGWHDPKVCTGLFAKDGMENSTIYFLGCRVVKLRSKGTLDYYLKTGVNQEQFEAGGDAGTEVRTIPDDPQMDQIIDKMLSEEFDDPKDFADLDEDDQEVLYDELMKAAKGAGDPYTERFAEAFVERMQARFG